jgi:hypothetical protein
MAYRPSFQRSLFAINILLALMHQILTHQARSSAVWSKTEAESVVAQSEVIFENMGIRVALDKYLDDLLRLQAGSIGLSRLGSSRLEGA